MRVRDRDRHIAKITEHLEALVSVTNVVSDDDLILLNLRALKNAVVDFEKELE